MPLPLQPTITMLAMVDPLAPSLKWPVAMSPESVRSRQDQWFTPLKPFSTVRSGSVPATVNGARICASEPCRVTTGTVNVIVCEPERTLPSWIAAFSVHLPPLSAHVPSPGLASAL